jgi:hypothetical protein
MDKQRYRELLRHCRRRQKNMQDRRSALESVWRDLARHFLPYKARFLGEQEDSGENKALELFDGEGVYSANVLAKGMQSGLSSQSSPWFRLALREKGLENAPGAKVWLHEVQEIMEEVYFPGSPGVPCNSC